MRHNPAPTRIHVGVVAHGWCDLASWSGQEGTLHGLVHKDAGMAMDTGLLPVSSRGRPCSWLISEAPGATMVLPHGAAAAQVALSRLW